METPKVISNFRKYGGPALSFLYQRYFSKKPLISFSGYRNPIFLRNNTSDIPTFHQVISDEEYNIDFGFDPKVIVDCGANIGLAAAYFKNRYRDAKIISIEPEPSNYELLLRNTAAYTNVHCINAGIWCRSAHLLIEDNGYGNWGFQVKEVDSGTDKTIEALSITDIMEKYEINQIDILKIDVEGSEKELFEMGFERWLPKTRVVIIELHEQMRPGATKSFFKAMSNYDFSLTYKGENIICFMHHADSASTPSG